MHNHTSVNFSAHYEDTRTLFLFQLGTFYVLIIKVSQ